MNRRYFADRSTRYLVVADIFVFSAGLAVSLFIRAQFTNFLVQPIDIAALAPLTIFLRLFTTVVFEHYSLGGTSYLFRDFTSLSLHNALTTTVLLVLRFFSSVRYFRLPISAIFIEYVISTFGMIMVRLFLSRLATQERQGTPQYRPRVLVWGEVFDLSRSGELRRIIDMGEVVVRGILSSNAMSWDSHHGGIRVFGDETVLRDVLLNDDSIAAICVAHPESVGRKRLASIAQNAQRYRMSLYRLENGKILSTSREELLQLADLRSERHLG